MHSARRVCFRSSDQGQMGHAVRRQIVIPSSQLHSLYPGGQAIAASRAGAGSATALLTPKPVIASTAAPNARRMLRESTRSMMRPSV